MKNGQAKNIGPLLILTIGIIAISSLYIHVFEPTLPEKTINRIEETFKENAEKEEEKFNPYALDNSPDELSEITAKDNYEYFIWTAYYKLMESDRDLEYMYAFFPAPEVENKGLHEPVVTQLNKKAPGNLWLQDNTGKIHTAKGVTCGYAHENSSSWWYEGVGNSSYGGFHLKKGSWKLCYGWTKMARTSHPFIENMAFKARQIFRVKENIAPHITIRDNPYTPKSEYTLGCTYEPTNVYLTREMGVKLEKVTENGSITLENVYRRHYVENFERKKTIELEKINVFD
ncbi:MAG: hypothetical protein ACLFUR_02915 [Candidatus Hadarchaeia archaeon]